MSDRLKMRFLEFDMNPCKLSTMRVRPLILGFSAMFVGWAASAQDQGLAGRPGLASPENPPKEIASCDNLHAGLKGYNAPDTRVDLWVTGPLSLIRTDGVLWYLVICQQPGIRVMCVTYSDNGMKVGERVMLKGAFSRQDDLHVLLDPCLASRRGA